MQQAKVEPVSMETVVMVTPSPVTHVIPTLPSTEGGLRVPSPHPQVGEVTRTVSPALVKCDIRRTDSPHSRPASAVSHNSMLHSPHAIPTVIVDKPQDAVTSPPRPESRPFSTPTPPATYTPPPQRVERLSRAFTPPARVGSAHRVVTPPRPASAFTLCPSQISPLNLSALRPIPPSDNLPTTPTATTTSTTSISRPKPNPLSLEPATYQMAPIPSPTIMQPLKSAGFPTGPLSATLQSIQTPLLLGAGMGASPLPGLGNQRTPMGIPNLHFWSSLSPIAVMSPRLGGSGAAGAAPPQHFQFPSAYMNSQLTFSPVVTVPAFTAFETTQSGHTSSPTKTIPVP